MFSSLWLLKFKVFKKAMKYTLFEVIITRFSGILEVVIIKMDYIFAPFNFWEAEWKNSFSIYFLVCNRWIISSLIKQNIQKMNRQLLVNNLNGFPQNSNIFLQILMIILKSRYYSKIIRFFSYYLNELLLETFPALK